MGRTIIQPIGPLYGEAVNGTVYGRPNGSIYVPSVNTIDISLQGIDHIRTGTGSGGVTVVYPCNSAGVIQYNKCLWHAESQDNAAYMAIQLAADDEFTVYDEAQSPAGLFNRTTSAVSGALDNVTLTDGEKYYCRLVLYAASGVPVAYSEALELTAVVPA